MEGREFLDASAHEWLYYRLHNSGLADMSISLKFSRNQKPDPVSATQPNCIKKTTAKEVKALAQW
jgi:hypothetical protein